MSVINRNQRLNGLNPLAYIGDNAYQPPEFVTDNRPPTPNDAQNFELGTIWLDRASNLPNPPKAENVWILVSLSGGSATWINFADGNALKTLTGNSGGAVSADAAQNINIVGDGTTINIVGNPATHTLTVSVVGTGVLQTLTGDSGGAVSPLAGNINTLGTAGKISVTGNPATHTLTWNLDGSVAQSFPTDAGTATPAAGVLNVIGGNNIHTTGAGNTVTVNVSGTTNHTVQLGNASGSLTSLANGTTGQILTAVTGADPHWAAPATFSSIVTQVFVANGTYTPTTGMKYCIIEVVGGGGGAGGSQSSATESAAGAGGGGGGYARKTVSAATIGVSQAVTVGTGGTGGTGVGGNGTNGGASSVGAIVSASGGVGGTYGSHATAFQTTYSGVGGVGSGGDINANGQPGGCSWAVGSGVSGYTGFSGFGGDSYFGGGARAVVQTDAVGMTVNGTNGTAYGGGGSGAVTLNGTGSGTGGNGADGVVIITEFI